jgi:hypothetical protein
MAIPPLSPDQVVRLATARDGRDHREEAFVALVEHVRQWSGGLGDAAIRLHPDLEALLADAGAHRGDLCRLSGVIQQQTRLGRPHEGVDEWFIRDQAGRPLLVYVVQRQAEPADRLFQPGRHITIDARFYKRVEMEARDGVVRAYPAFVGAHPRLVVGPRGQRGQLGLVAVPVAILLLAFIAVLIYARRRRPPGRGPHRPAPLASPPIDEPPLPDDPAEALAELNRRASE